MAMTYVALKYLHLIGAIVLLGTGTGIAFFMLMAHRSGVADFIARTAAVVVKADIIFTLTAALLQPVTGYLLLVETGRDPDEAWVVASMGLYVIAGLFWLPVVWMQARMRDLAKAAAASGAVLPPAYHRLFRIWFLFGIPGFGSVAGIVLLMILRPA